MTPVRSATPLLPPRAAAMRALVALLVAVSIVVALQANASASVFGYATTLPVPKGESALNERVASVACTSAHSCEAAGIYNGLQPVVVNEVGGRWVSATRILLPANASPGGGGLTSIDCTSPGDCVAAGTYQTDLETAPMLATEQSGTWARAIEAPLPPNASTGPRTFAYLYGVACSSPANCVAVGNTQIVGDPIGRAFVDTGAGATWTASEPEMPAGASEAVLSAVTCLSTGCVAVGAASTASATLPVAVAEEGGTWGQAVSVEPPGKVSAGGEAFELEGLTSVSCPAAGSCVAGGIYLTAARDDEPFVAAETDGTWGVGRGVAPPSGATKQSAALGGIACSTVENCVAVGSYTPSGDGGRALGMTASEVGGTWQRAVPSSLPPGGGPMAYTTAVACPTVASCTTVGVFTAGSGVSRSFASTPATLPGRAVIQRVVPGPGQLTVTIRAPLSSGGLAIETYQYSLDGGSSWHDPRGATASARLVLGSLARKHRFRLAVRAVTEAGAGPMSNVVVATTT